MITYVEGDLFSSTAQVLVNTVNTVGVMGKGIAKEFKAIYPEMFKVYQGYCERGELEPGKLLLYRTNNKWILNFPTKRHWRQKSRLVDIEAGLKSFSAQYVEMGISSIAFPQLGCGNGELDWELDVRPLMERFLLHLPIDVTIFIYPEAPSLAEHRDRKNMIDWLRSEPQSLPFTEVWDDIEALCWDSNIGQLGEKFGEPILTLSVDEAKVEILKSDVFGLWQRLKNVGVIPVDELVSVAGVDNERLAMLLVRLPYIESVAAIHVGSSQKNLTGTVIELLHNSYTNAIRLVPEIEATLAPRSKKVFSEKEVSQLWMLGEVDAAN